AGTPPPMTTTPCSDRLSSGSGCAPSVTPPTGRRGRSRSSPAGSDSAAGGDQEEVGGHAEQEPGQLASQGDLPRQAPADGQQLAEDVEDGPGGQGQAADED